MMLVSRFIIGTHIDTIREYALKNQWTLTELKPSGHKIESGTVASTEIKIERDANIHRTKAGKYSKHYRVKKYQFGKG